MKLTQGAIFYMQGGMLCNTYKLSGGILFYGASMSGSKYSMFSQKKKHSTDIICPVTYKQGAMGILLAEEPTVQFHTKVHQSK